MISSARTSKTDDGGFESSGSFSSGIVMSRLSFGPGEEVYGVSIVNIEVALGLCVGLSVLSLDSIVVRG